MEIFNLILNILGNLSLFYFVLIVLTNFRKDKLSFFETGVLVLLIIIASSAL